MWSIDMNSEQIYRLIKLHYLSDETITIDKSYINLYERINNLLSSLNVYKGEEYGDVNNFLPLGNGNVLYGKDEDNIEFVYKHTEELYISETIFSEFCLNISMNIKPKNSLLSYIFSDYFNKDIKEVYLVHKFIKIKKVL